MEQGLELCVHGSRIWREMWVTDSAEFWIGKARRSAFSVGVALLVRAPCGRRGVYTEVTPRFGEGVYSPAPRDKEEAYVALGMGGADINLHQVAGAGNRVLLGFAHGIGTRTQGAARTRHGAAKGLDQPSLAFHLAQDAAHHGSGHPDVLLPEQDG